MMRNIFILIFICVGLSSCSTDDYSCDPEINKWVSDNIDEIHSMIREEWVETTTFQSNVERMELLQ